LNQATSQNFLEGARTISPFHFGICGIYKFNDKMAIDANVNIGPSIHLDIENDFVAAGNSLTIESKLRMKNFAIGVLYIYSKMDDSFGENNPKRFMLGNTFAVSLSKQFNK
jgi:hypothetical protein